MRSSDFADLRSLAEACKDRFAFGIVLYDSTDVVPFGLRVDAGHSNGAIECDLVGEAAADEPQ